MSSTDTVYRQPGGLLPGELEEFPFPFPRDTYRYSVNVEPAGEPRSTATGQWGKTVLHVDGRYGEQLAEKRRILTDDPTRAAALDHMVVPQWDAMITILRELAQTYPEDFALVANGENFTFVNRLLDTEHDFVLGDCSTLPVPPLEFAALNAQEDLVVLDQRSDSLWADALAVAFAADWSPHFDVGMSFPQIHGPVPRIHAAGVVDRAHRFLMGLQPGETFRRTNWTLTIDGRLDTATETYDDWGPDRRALVEGPEDEIGDRLHLRVEVQHLIRLEWSGSILFLIRTYLQPFSSIARVPDWATRVADVLEELPADMAEYKGIDLTRGPGARWLRRHADTATSSSPTTSGATS